MQRTKESCKNQIRDITTQEYLVSFLLGCTDGISTLTFFFLRRYVFAIVFTDVSNEYANGFQEINEESLAFLRKYFFDLERSVNTLFQSICNGLNWGDVADKLNELSRVWGYLYVIFVAFCFLIQSGCHLYPYIIEPLFLKEKTALASHEPSRLVCSLERYDWHVTLAPFGLISDAGGGFG